MSDIYAKQLYGLGKKILRTPLLPINFSFYRLRPNLKFWGAKERIQNLQSLLTSIISLARCNEDNGYKRTLFVRTWFSNSGHQNLSIALLTVSSFFNGSIIFMENVNPIRLSSYSQFVSVKWKKRNTSCNQCLLSVTNELSSNLNNKFRCSLVKNINLKL